MLVGALCFGLGAGAFYAWSQYAMMQEENTILKAQLEKAPQQPEIIAEETLAPAESASPTAAMEEKKQVPQNGAISGTIGYPSEGIPPMTVYAMKQGDKTTYFKLNTKQNQQTFTLTDLPVGTYVVFAYPQDTEALVGGYSKAVPCGLAVDCKDHSLIPVVVTANKTTPNVAIKDWYAPEGSFPAKPQ
jgi:hypothetical protein